MTCWKPPYGNHGNHTLQLNVNDQFDGFGPFGIPVLPRVSLGNNLLHLERFATKCSTGCGGGDCVLMFKPRKLQDSKQV